MLRTVAERLSRGRSFRYRLPQIYGGCRLYITPEAGLRYWIPSRGIKAGETLLRSAAETVKPGSVVWDVGANMGLFSFAAAGMAGAQGRVYAFEPDAVMARLLRRAIQRVSGLPRLQRWKRGSAISRSRQPRNRSGSERGVCLTGISRILPSSRARHRPREPERE